ncbi:MAG TPA: molybdopterin-dependent oxidoreductase [Bacteroidota bacterium]|nr:molybdopterin-dependent oxidoreductase [Bacteroidota bacterium]
MELQRRDFLKIIGATTVATTLPGCGIKQPKSLIPYVIPEESITPGKSVWYASVCQECPAGCGISVRVREGRAVKVEGNPLHPTNDGALCARGQAALQGLYNPDRVQHPMRKGEDGKWRAISWDEALKTFVDELQKIQKAGKGGDVVLLSGHVSGALEELLGTWIAAVGSKNHLRYEPFAHESLRKAQSVTFGVDAVPFYDFAAADTVIAFDADFLETWISPVEYAKGFTRHRGYTNGKRGTYLFVGPRLSMTASNADSWFSVNPGTEGVFALGMVRVILEEKKEKGVSAADALRISSMVSSFSPDAVSKRTGVPAEAIRQAALIFASSSSGLAVAGGTMVEGDSGVATIAAVNLLNYICGNIGKTVTFGPSSLSRLASYDELALLADQMNGEKVAALVMTDVNPVFDTPDGLDFARAMQRVPFIVSLSSFMSETSELANLILPTHTPLESWGDVEVREGVHGLMQPAMQPVFDTRMLGDLLLESGQKLGRTGNFPHRTMYDFVRARWMDLHKRLGGKSDFESFWVECLARGGYWEKSRSESHPSLSQNLNSATFEPLAGKETAKGGTFDLILYPSIAHYDGRGANRPWLQELPDPMAMNVWDSWLEIHPQDAAAAGINTGDVVQISSPYARFEIAAHVSTTVKPGAVAIPIGQGHTAYGRYANNVGRNPIDLLDPKPSERTGGLEWAGMKVEVVKRPYQTILATVSGSDVQHNRGIIQSVPLDELSKPGNSEADKEQALSMYPEQEYPHHRWGMTIDIDKCTGCSACVTACYAENNIPIVGKEEVNNGREMAWIRIERYFDEQSPVPRADFAPMLCQQCDDAPCETVCPVYAAYHTEEGLNGQVYNRCIGTRYCANNCPYKVRRFNWYEAEWVEPLNWQLNPDVTVRTKGVMEKCTFCVQRIVEGKNTARNEQRPVRDGEIVPACAQTCPAEAITFGDLKDRKSRVSELIAEEGKRDYRILEELNTRPAVTYLKAIKREIA